MQSLEIFKEYLKNSPLKAKSFHPYFEEALNYMLQSGGKHFRAQLLLGVVERINPSLLNDALGVALGVEMIHTYSLIHDDLPTMDNADLRRGRVTTHKKYDEVTALLVGDALNSYAFYQISSSNLDPITKLKCVEILSNAAFEMVIGQAIDCYFEKKTLSLDELKFLHNHKTGALISASLKMGAVIAGLGDDLSEAGLKLGLLFQVVDDIIDATKTSDEAGKPTNNDEFKNSFTNLVGVEKAINFQEKLILEIENLSIDERILELLKELINKYLKG